MNEINEFSARRAAAVKRVASLDKMGGRPDRELLTILFALEAGLKNPASDAHFDALVMLEDRVRQATK